MKKLDTALTGFFVIFCLLGALIVGTPVLLILGIKPWDIPGTYPLEKRAIARMNQNMEPMPPGFSHAENPMWFGGINVHAEGRGSFKEAARAHSALADAVDKARYRREIRMKTIADTTDAKIHIVGRDTENIVALTVLVDRLAGPAKMVVVDLDDELVSVYSGPADLDEERYYSGPCAASRAEYVANLPEIAKVQQAGFSVEGFFAFCTDSDTPGASFAEDADPAAIRDTDRLLNGPLGKTVKGVTLETNGDLSIRFTPGFESSESQWRQSWKHGEIVVLQR